MATSTYYGWAEPDNSSLVKNGASDIRTLGNAIDASLWNVGYGQAGKNAIINGAIEIWQRGTSDVTLTAASFLYWADRWFGARAAGTSGAKIKYISASGLDGLPNVFRIQRDSGNTATDALYACYDLETKDSLRFAGRTVTLSFYARAGANYSPTSSQLNVKLASGTGTDQGGYATTWTGSTSFISTNQAITTSWVRYSFTGTVATSATQLGLILTVNPTGTAGANDYVDITGVQLEVGSTATPFSRNASSIQGELAACQRYYFRTSPTASGMPVTSSGGILTTTIGQVYTPFPVTMRVNPTAMDYSAINWYNFGNNTEYNTGTFTMTTATPNFASVRYTHGSAIFTTGQSGAFTTSSASSYLGFTAEL